MSRQFSRDWFTEVARGNIPGHTAIIVFGHNTDVDAGVVEDVWEQGGTLVRMTSAETMNIVSTSTDDDGSPVGAGARTVQIKGLDGSFDPVSETVTMNGTTNVETSNTYIRVNELKVLTADASATNANVGNISATASSAATVQCFMEATDGLSHKIHYTVPNGKTAYLYKIELNVFKVSGANAGVKFDAVVTPLNAASFKLTEKATESDLTEIDLQHPFPVPFAAKTDLKVTALSDTANTELYARCFFIEIDD